MSIHGVVQHGTILPLDPLPPEWSDGRHVVIEDGDGVTPDERTEIEDWYANLEALGAAQYEPGEREAIEEGFRVADRDAKEHVRRSWARFDDAFPSRHEPPQRGDRVGTCVPALCE